MSGVFTIQARSAGSFGSGPPAYNDSNIHTGTRTETILTDVTYMILHTNIIHIIPNPNVSADAITAFILEDDYKLMIEKISALGESGTNTLSILKSMSTTYEASFSDNQLIREAVAVQVSSNSNIVRYMTRSIYESLMATINSLQAGVADQEVAACVVDMNISAADTDDQQAIPTSEQLTAIVNVLDSKPDDIEDSQELLALIKQGVGDNNPVGTDASIASKEDIYGGMTAGTVSIASVSNVPESILDVEKDLVDVSGTATTIMPVRNLIQMVNVQPGVYLDWYNADGSLNEIPDKFAPIVYSREIAEDELNELDQEAPLIAQSDLGTIQMMKGYKQAAKIRRLGKYRTPSSARAFGRQKVQRDMYYMHELGEDGDVTEGDRCYLMPYITKKGRITGKWVDSKVKLDEEHSQFDFLVLRKLAPMNEEDTDVIIDVMAITQRSKPYWKMVVAEGIDFEIKVGRRTMQLSKFLGIMDGLMKVVRGVSNTVMKNPSMVASLVNTGATVVGAAFPNNRVVQKITNVVGGVANIGSDILSGYQSTRELSPLEDNNKIDPRSAATHGRCSIYPNLLRAGVTAFQGATVSIPDQKRHVADAQRAIIDDFRDIPTTFKSSKYSVQSDTNRRKNRTLMR
jgi:hypothetical protein